jgi:hypothetical protein
MIKQSCLFGQLYGVMKREKRNGSPDPEMAGAAKDKPGHRRG